ncbi:MAG: DUF992 domain-containing protein [Roseobacter sp.]
MPRLTTNTQTLNLEEAQMSKNLTNLSKVIAAASLAAGLTISPASAQSPVKLGQMDCMVTDSDKTLLETHIVLDCSYIDANGNNAGTYKGAIDRAGLDIGNMATEQFTWIVSTLGDPADAKIAGTYLGAATGASAGSGAGVNYLTGGFDGKISLQPLSAETKSGFGMSLAGQKLELEKVDS